MKNIAVDVVKILEEVENFFEEFKNDEDYKALMAKYEIENENLWFCFAFLMYKANLCDRNLRGRDPPLFIMNSSSGMLPHLNISSTNATWSNGCNSKRPKKFSDGGKCTLASTNITVLNIEEKTAMAGR